ncbi:MAG TPA: Zn-ribbon domain-containing OB-fold protein [Candidatus Limnocylindrales bacterium]|nr:Zn-ribbon domain-containing OB-fold protein [Candidatus Limnocylindrales bacterium]
MSEVPASGHPLPVVEFLKLGKGGEPYLEGQRCGACGAVFLGTRTVCSKCGARGKLEARRLAERGTLYAYSIVHRSFPGVAVPYVSAIVDLEGGGTVKGNLVDVEPDPSRIRFGMPVKVVFRDALGRKDKDGNSYLSYFFVPDAA